MTRSLLFSFLALGLCGCPQSSSAPEGQRRTAELADKLVSCQNERSSLKEELGGVRAELQRAKAQKQQEVAAPEQAPRAGRTPHRNLPSHDVVSSRPSVHGRGPDNPEAEAKAAQEMAQQLRSQGGQFRPCYERGLKRNANLQFVNQIKVRVTVAPDGRAKDVRISPRTEADMEACIVQVMSSWRVSAFKGQPVLIELPVNLRIQGR